jgi:hypothetical protein
MAREEWNMRIIFIRIVLASALVAGLVDGIGIAANFVAATYDAFHHVAHLAAGDRTVECDLTSNRPCE